jgi:hypothetical protein
MQSPINMWNPFPQYVQLVYKKKIKIHTFDVAFLCIYSKMITKF